MRACWPLFLLSTPALASIALPFSTSFDCAEQDQSQWTSGWVTCDGLSRDGNWTTSPTPAYEQITSAANRAGGGGGRGQRHWIGDGTNNSSGSIAYSFSSPVPQVYVRWYVRFQQGLAMANSGGSHKFFYFNGTQCQGHASGCYLLMQPNNILLVVAGTAYQDSTFGWNDLHGGVNSADGQWHCMEVFAQTNAAGTGVVKWWVDGTLRLDKNNVDFRSPYGGFYGFTMPSNGVFNTSVDSDGNMFEDIDDVKIQTTGPIGCDAAPPADTIGPAAPTGLTVR